MEAITPTHDVSVNNLLNQTPTGYREKYGDDGVKTKLRRIRLQQQKPKILISTSILPTQLQKIRSVKTGKGSGWTVEDENDLWRLIEAHIHDRKLGSKTFLETIIPDEVAERLGGHDRVRSKVREWIKKLKESDS